MCELSLRFPSLRCRLRDQFSLPDDICVCRDRLKEPLSKPYKNNDRLLENTYLTQHKNSMSGSNVGTFHSMERSGEFEALVNVKDR